jgi:hypothetical protein
VSGRHTGPAPSRSSLPTVAGVSVTPRRQEMLGRLGVPLLLLLALGVSLRPGLENDAWWHMASGRWMLEERSWLRVDVFSWTVLGEGWPRPGLVADVAMAALHGIGGVPLLVAGAAACFVAAVAIVLLGVRASPLATVTVGTLSVLTMVVAATPRPLVASLPLTAATVLVLDRETRSRDGSRWLWTLPLLALVWVNVHGTFVVLFVLIGCHGLAHLVDALRGRRQVGWWRSVRRLVVAGILAGLATLLNPFGAAMLLYPIETLQLGVLSEAIHEWRRPVLTDPQFWPLFALVGITMVALARSDERRTSDAVVLVVFGGLSLTAARHAAIFAIVAFPIVAGALSRRPHVGLREAWGAAAPRERTIELAVLAVVGVLVAILVAPALTPSGNNRAIAAWHGDRAIARVAAGDLPGRLWNSYDLGGHVIWLGAPDLLVSIDSRTDLYGDEAVREHLAEWHGEREAPARFAAQGIGTVLVERQAPLVQQLTDSDWSRVEEDAVAVVLRAPDGRPASS